MNDQSDRLDLAWKLLEDEGAERALQAAADLDESNVETWVLRATAQIDLMLLHEAAAACDRAEKLGGREHLGVLWARGEIALARWEVDEASRCYEAILAQAHDEGAALERLALVRELQRRYGEADELLERAQAIDPELYPLPPRLEEDEVDDVIEEAAAALPEALRKHLEEVPIVVELAPPLELGRTGPPGDIPPDLLGLFVGSSLLERNEEDPLGGVPRIYLFQRNIERACQDRDDVVEQVRVTLYHELGHYLGFDEEGVDELGLG
jgi:predicted Zn-dependent protease with MMP-like domain